MQSGMGGSTTILSTLDLVALSSAVLAIERRPLDREIEGGWAEEAGGGSAAEGDCREGGEVRERPSRGDCIGQGGLTQIDVLDIGGRRGAGDVVAEDVGGELTSVEGLEKKVISPKAG